MKRILFFLSLLPLFGFAQDIPAKPTTYVTDEANVLSANEEKTLNHKLRLFKDSTSSQICVYVASSLKGRDMVSLCQQIFNKWDIGQKDKDNGVLIAVFVNDHKFRIHTGYGMEGALPDVLTKKIQDEYMRPSFKQGNYYEGINKGVDQLIYYSKHEYKADADNGEDAWIGFIILYSICAVVLLLNALLIRYLFKHNKAAKTGLWITATVIFLVPFVGLVVLVLTLIIMSIVSLVKLTNKSRGASYSSGSGGTYTDRQDYSWSSSSSSDSDYSGNSSSDDSYSGGGGDSGGGGSSSDW